jgi:hypothetical protein
VINDRYIKFFELCLCGIIFCLAFIFCYRCGIRGFFPLDQSIVYDGAWRIIQGQIPFKDFICPIGPIVFLYQAELFCLFGVNFNAYVLGAAILNALASIATFLIIKKLYPNTIASPLIGAILCAVWFFSPMGTTYADQMSLFFCLISLLTYLLAFNNPEEDYSGYATVTGSGNVIFKGNNIKISHALVIFSGFLWMLAFLTKQNFAAFFLPLFPVLMVLAFFEKLYDILKFFLFFTAGIAICATFFCLWLFTYSNPVNFWIYFFQIPFNEGMRRFGVDLPTFFTIIVFASFGSVCVGFFIIKKLRNSIVNKLLLLSASITVFLLIYIYVMLKTTNNNPINGFGLSGVVIGFAFAIASNWKSRYKVWKNTVLFSLSTFCICFFFFGLYSCWVRKANDFFPNSEYVKFSFPSTMIPMEWAEPTPAGTIGGRRVIIKKHEVASLLKYLIRSDSKFFVFADFTALYGFTGKSSPQPLLWFHKGLTYPKKYDKHLDEWIVESLKKNKIDTVVFEEASWFGSYLMLNDFPLLNRYIMYGFEKKGSFGIYSIYKVKKRIK